MSGCEDGRNLIHINHDTRVFPHSACRLVCLPDPYRVSGRDADRD